MGRVMSAIMPTSTRTLDLKRSFIHYDMTIRLCKPRVIVKLHNDSLQSFMQHAQMYLERMFEGLSYALQSQNEALSSDTT